MPPTHQIKVVLEVSVEVVAVPLVTQDNSPIIQLIGDHRERGDMGIDNKMYQVVTEVKTPEVVVGEDPTIIEPTKEETVVRES